MLPLMSSRRGHEGVADHGHVAVASSFSCLAGLCFAPRLIQDMFFILTMLVLAQFWNLLAGYGGLVSVGQQAFVGMGAYAMFGGVILGGWTRSLDPDCRCGGPAAGHSHGVLRLPPAGPLFRHRHLGDRRGHAACGGAGKPSAAAPARRCPVRPPARCGRRNGIERCLTYATPPRGTSSPTGWHFARGRHHRRHLLAARTKRGLALAAVRDNPEAAKSVGVDAGRMKWTVFLVSAFGTGLAGG
jgi:branched-chain amino acid transport system permease protein